jgi:hypothetical protein
MLTAGGGASTCLADVDVELDAAALGLPGREPFNSASASKTSLIAGTGAGSVADCGEEAFVEKLVVGEKLIVSKCGVLGDDIELAGDGDVVVEANANVDGGVRMLNLPCR